MRGFSPADVVAKAFGTGLVRALAALAAGKITGADVKTLKTAFEIPGFYLAPTQTAKHKLTPDRIAEVVALVREPGAPLEPAVAPAPPPPPAGGETVRLLQPGADDERPAGEPAQRPINGHARPPAAPRGPKPREHAPARVARPREPKPVPAPPPPPRPIVLRPPPEGPDGPATLVDIGPGRCHWPIKPFGPGEGADVPLCGRPRISDPAYEGSYCEEHEERSHGTSPWGAVAVELGRDPATYVEGDSVEA